MNHVIKEILKATFLKKYRSIALLCVNVLTAICTLTGRTLTTIEPLWLWIIILGTFIISSLILWRMFLNQVSKEFDNKEKFVSQQETKINELKNTISGFRDYLSFIYCLIEPFSAINKINRKDNINEETLQKEMLLFCTRLKEAFEHLDNTSSGRSIVCLLKLLQKKLIFTIDRFSMTWNSEIHLEIRTVFGMQTEMRIYIKEHDIWFHKILHIGLSSIT